MIIYYSTFNEGYANMRGRNCVAGKKLIECIMIMKCRSSDVVVWTRSSSILHSLNITKCMNRSSLDFEFMKYYKVYARYIITDLNENYWISYFS